MDLLGQEPEEAPLPRPVAGQEESSRGRHGTRVVVAASGGSLVGIGIVTGGVLTFGPLPVIAIMALSAVIIALIIVLVVVVRDSRR